MLVSHSSNLSGSSEQNLQELKINRQQLLIIFSDMFQTGASSAILELYINLLFSSENEQDYSSKFHYRIIS
jgi:hypothetical protein